MTPMPYPEQLPRQRPFRPLKDPPRIQGSSCLFCTWLLVQYWHVLEINIWVIMTQFILTFILYPPLT